MSDNYNALPAGHTLKDGEYRIERELGVGGFGITYLATETTLNKKVAIKEYLPNDFAMRAPGATVQPKSASSHDDYAWGLKSFLNEAHALAMFEHPNINRVERYFEENGTAYMALEYIEGETLTAVLKREQTLSAEHLTRLIDDLLAGLEQVHTADFVHRDIKPTNIMFRADGQAVLIDFGAARQAIGSVTRSITVVLTPGYAPAEQYARRSDKVGAWSDLYALGMVAYRCISGINDRDLPDSVERQLAAAENTNDPLRPASEVARGAYPPGLLTAIDAATRINYQDRPQSVAAMRALMGDETPASTQPPAIVPPPNRLPRPTAKPLATGNRALRYAAGGLVVMAVGFLSVWAWLLLDDYRQERAADQVATPQRAADQAATLLCAEKRAEVTRTSGVHERTELHLAAQNNDLYRAKQLLTWCAEVNAKSNFGSTPLHHAVLFYSLGVAKLLLANGAEVNAKNNAGSTPLDYTKGRGHTAMTRLLEQHGGRCNNLCKNGG